MITIGKSLLIVSSVILIYTLVKTIFQTIKKNK